MARLSNPLSIARAQQLLDEKAALLSFGAGSVGSSVTPRFLFATFTDKIAELTASQIRAARPGTLQNLWIRHNVPGGNGNAILYTVRINNTPTALTVSLASTATDALNSLDQIVVVAGDLIDIRVTKAAGVGSSPRNVFASLEIV